ncbi:sugar-binding transcriptional regulator [Candidatus Sarcina troglodytae]|uniref:sugar-binding transcriptional regulator n=1 Tax=Candidatus Sarcina troglodytae TaxID=2726954 RepID=UPI001FAB4537|nr:sugar-binding transcriptional regulator [Sarcina sp. JB2]
MIENYEKMNKTEQLSFLAEISNMYYNLGMTQSEIANKVSSTRFKIAKYLQEAREKQVVEISINYPRKRMLDLEETFKKKFDLKNIFILNTTIIPYDEIIPSLGKIGAKYLDSIIENNYIIGVLWGKTLANMIKYLNPKEKKSITVLQLVGSAAKDDPLIDSPELIRKVANSYGGGYKYLHTPLYVDNEYARAYLLQEPVIHDTLFLANKSDIILSGIGTTEAAFASSLWSKYLVHDLKPQNAVGCIYGHAYDINGKLINSDINKKVIGVDLKTILNIKYRIAIASGKLKAEAILGALKGKFVNVLITDEDTALKILSLCD